VSCTKAACFSDGGPGSDASNDAATPADAGGCVYGGKPHAEGESFPSLDGCNQCMCAGDGVGCTKKACLPDAGPAPACAVGAKLDYGAIGGLRIYTSRSYVGPGSQYRQERVYRGSAPPIAPFCEPPLPACASDGRTNPSTVQSALGDPEVQKALAAATPPLFGRDNRPVDGTVFEVKREGGGGLLIGNPCGDPSGTPCAEIPAGIEHLRTVLLALDEQQLATPACKAVFK
jgi:hypothetical protein